jgi:hypothetical protein
MLSLNKTRYLSPCDRKLTQEISLGPQTYARYSRIHLADELRIIARIQVYNHRWKPRCKR